MQKAAAIILLALMTLFFHGRQLSYMQCLLVNEFRQGVPLCNCEPIITIQPQDGDAHKEHAQHQHFSLAEWYIQQPQTSLTFSFPYLPARHYTVYTQRMYNNYCFAMLKPPRVSYPFA